MSLVPDTIVSLAEDETIGGGKNIVAGASVNITKSTGGSASIFSDAAGTSAISLPTVTDSNGELKFWIAPGLYIYTVAGENYNVNISEKNDFVIETFADIATTPATAGAVYYLKEYLIGTGKGGGQLIAKHGVITPDNFRTFATATAGVYLERASLNLNTDDYAMSNSNTVTENSNRLIALLAFAVANGIRDIRVGTAFAVNDVATVIHDKGLVFFYGEQIAGLYRRASLPEQPISNIRPFERIPSDALRQFSTATMPTVVMMGDSISGYSVSGCTPVDSMWGVITNEIQKDNPSTTFNFYNRGIGGQVWANANTFPSSFPSWYADPLVPWLDYIEVLQPDLLFLAFGMNDEAGFDAASMHAVLNKINLWTKVPSIVLVTTPNPAMSTRFGGGSGFYGRASQEGRDYVAGYTRAVASYYGYGLLDINRQTNLLRDGRDITSCPMGMQIQVVGSWVLSPTRCHEYYFNGGLVSWPDGKNLRFQVGAGEQDYVTITKTGSTFDIVARTAGAGNYKIINYAAPSPSAVTSMSLSVTATRIVIAVNGETEIAAFNCLRHGGDFFPRVSFTNETNGPFASYVLSLGSPDRVNQTLTDDMIWGPMSADASDKLPDGGNGVNHYSSQGIARIVRPVVRWADFTRRPSIYNVRTGTLEPLSAGTTTVFQPMTAERLGNIVSIKGIVQITGTAIETSLCQLPSTMLPTFERLLVGTKLVSGVWSQCVIRINAGGLVSFYETAPATRVSIDVSFLI